MSANKNQCQVPPKGWKCTRESGHDGPCAAVKVHWWDKAVNSFGDALGEFMFGGQR